MNPSAHTGGGTAPRVAPGSVWPIALLAIFLSSCFLAAFAPTTAVAQGAKARKEQRRLDADARAAVKRRDYDLAVELLNRSLELGELNITYLNLGRAYHHADRCAEAIDAYSRVPFAPKVENPPADAIKATLERFERETLERCAASVTIDCGPEVASVEVDEEKVGCGEVVALPPGEHRAVVFIKSGEQRLQRFELAPRQAFTLVAPVPTLEVEPLGVIVDVPQPEAERPSAGNPVLPFVLATLGVAAVGTGVWLYLANQEAIDEITTLDSSPEGLVRYDMLKTDIEQRDIFTVVAFGAGVVCATGSVLLFLLDGSDDPEPSPTARGQIDVAISPWGVSTAVRF